MVQLDGGNTIIGTEFIKLLATGSSNLATGIRKYSNNQWWWWGRC